VAGNICEDQAADATGSATRNVLDIAATLSLAEGLAIHPDIETGQFDSAERELPASPDLHALHVLCEGIGHGSIIAAEGEISLALASRVSRSHASKRLPFKKWTVRNRKVVAL
jgi:hypothetical protein